MPQGGAITLGGTLPIMFVAWRYGLNVGLVEGFLFGITEIFIDPFILHPVQVLFDYPLPFMMLGLAALFPKNFFVGAAAAAFGMFLCHFISGVVFFGSYAPDGTSAVMWSLMINGANVAGDLLVVLLLIKLLPIRRLLDAMDKDYVR